WSSSDQPVGRVRATARSQSLPTANTSDNGSVVVRLTLAAPVAPAAIAETPTPPVPCIAITVSDCANPLFDGVDRTVTFETGFSAVACQISLSPERAFSHLTSVHVKPPPLTVVVCFPAPAGPSLETSASSVSSGAPVVNAG